jgi:hypothetical protein
MSHVLFPDSSFTLWHDGSHHLRINPWKIVDTVLSDRYSFAAFRHPKRDCVYQEIEACIGYRMDSLELLTSQKERYMRVGYPAHNGLFETGCVVRRQCSEVRRLNESWFKEIYFGSCRDQVALPYALWRTGFKDVSTIPGRGKKSKFFSFRSHK